MALGKRKIEFLLEAKDRTARAFTKAKKNITDLAAKAASFARSIGGGLGLFSGAAGAGALAAIKGHADEIDRLGKKAEALGIRTEELSKLAYAAELTGSSMTGVADALEKMLNRVSKAAEGTGEAKDAIAEIGLEAAELEKLAPEEQFKLIADAISNVSTQADKVRLKRAIFGRGDANIINLLSQTSAGIGRMGEELESLDGVITDTDAAAAAEFADSMLRLSTNLDALGRSAGGPAIDNLNTLFEMFGLDTGIEAVETDIAQLRYEIERTERFLAGKSEGLLEGFASVFTPDSVLRERIEKYKARLKDLQKIKENWAKKDAETETRKASLQAAADHNKKMEAIRQDEKDKLKKAHQAQEEEFKRHEAALEASRDRQASLLETIAEAIEDFTEYGKEEPKVPDRMDTIDAVAAAWDNISAGDTAGARAALEALIEMFRAYQEAGKASKADVITMVAQLEALADATNQLESKGMEKRTKRAKEEAEALKEEIKNAPIEAPVNAAKDAGKVVRDQTQEQLFSEQPVVVQVGIQLAGEIWGSEGGTGGAPGTAPGGGSDVQSQSIKRGFRI